MSTAPRSALLVVSCAVASLTCANPDPTSSRQSASDFHPSGYELVFEDEFDGDELNRRVWCTRYIYGGGAKPQIVDPECQRGGGGTADALNDEKQRYVDFNARDERMHVVTSGVLHLRATKTGRNARAPYESAMLRSKRVFAPTADTSYYITARVKLPKVRGTWPAFWLNSDRKADGTANWPPEIDIFEGALNEVEDTEHMLRIGAQIRSSAQTRSGKREITFSAPELDLRWHTYRARESLRERWIETGAEWTTNGVCYFVDGYKVMCENYRWAYNDGAAAASAHILLNLAIGGNWAGRHGIADGKFPTEFRIDYVRVYAKTQSTL